MSDTYNPHGAFGWSGLMTDDADAAEAETAGGKVASPRLTHPKSDECVRSWDLPAPRCP